MESNALVTKETLAELTVKTIAEGVRLIMEKLLNGCDYDFDVMACVLSLRAHTSIELARHHVAAMVKTMVVKLCVL